jgi:hypothetical protein
MVNINSKRLTLFFLVLIWGATARAQVSESCDCNVDTIGFSSFVQTLDPDEEAVFQFHVNGKFAVAYGIIDGTTPKVVQDLIDKFPQVTTIVMLACPGSENDEANLKASLLLRKRGYKMYLPKGAFIGSGAVDMFLLGSQRVIDATYKSVGVHAWSDGIMEATDFPKGHAYHQLYISYYMRIGLTQEQAENFYYFTIYAASADDIHWMTEEELDQYQVRTCKYSSQPNYTVSRRGTSLIADLKGAKYQWLDCTDNKSIAGAESQTFTPSKLGKYAVFITEKNCSDTSACFSNEATGLANSKFGAGFNVFPNPTSGSVQIDLDQEYSTVELSLESVNGELVGKQEFKHSRQVYLDFQAPQGYYILKIKSEHNLAVYRIFNI